MECRYCQTVNAEDDHRCRRCGRRLGWTTIYSSSAAVPVPQDEPVAQPAIRAQINYRPEIVNRAGQPSTARKAVTYQPSLFGSRELPQVVPFESIAPKTLQPAIPRTSPPIPRVRHRKALAGQRNLDFSPARSARPSEGVIYCDAPVAIPVHRAMAAVLDSSLVLIAVAVFGLIFHIAGGRIILNATTVPVFAAVVAAVMFFYKLLWCLAGGDTAGMKWTRLTLVNFDGQIPGREQRLYRLASGCLSFLAAGVGLLWALVDEETLAWHDHMSRTFPTPY
jgi:uncharacterized RDD family membrane protein YckC